MTLIFLTFLTGCAAQSKERQVTVTLPQNMDQETVEALQGIADDLKQQGITNEDIKRIADDLKNDKEAQSAVEAVKNAVTNQNVVVKYCPMDGKRFSSKFTICPEHKVELKQVE